MSIILGLLTTKLFALLGGTGALGIGARILGYDRKAAAIAGRLPKWVWIALAVIAVLVGGYFVHRHIVHQFRAEVQRAQMAADNDHWKRKLAEAHADAIAWKKKAEDASAKISHEERARNEETIRRDAADAGALRLRGPGAAASHCRPLDHPAAGAGSSGHEQATPVADAAGPQVPAGDWAIVPWSWLVQRAQEHDDGTAENVAWRSNDARQRAAAIVDLQDPVK